MAKLRVFKTIENDVYIMRFENDPVALSQQDKMLMQRFGEPTINVGGTFGTTPNDFTFPDEYVRIRSDFPYTRTFDSKGTPFDTNILVKTASYETAITTAFTDAFTTLRANNDAYTGEVITNV